MAVNNTSAQQGGLPTPDRVDDLFIRLKDGTAIRARLEVGPNNEVNIVPIEHLAPNPNQPAPGQGGAAGGHPIVPPSTKPPASKPSQPDDPDLFKQDYPEPQQTPQPAPMPQPQPGTPPPGAQPSPEKLGRKRGLSGTLKPEDVDPKDLPKLEDAVFRARLRSVMTDNKYDRRLKGRTRGRLDMTRLYKAKTKTPSIFTQKQSRKGKQYNVTLVVDQSSSMEDPVMHNGQMVRKSDGRLVKRKDLAAEIAELLCKSFEGLNLNLEIIGFGSYAYFKERNEAYDGTDADYDKWDKKEEELTKQGTITYMVHKQFNDQYPDQQKLAEQLLMQMGGTDGYPAVKRAYDDLAHRQGKKVMLFLSDGDTHHAEEIEALNEANKNRVAAVGIGIGADGHADMFPENFQVTDMTKLKHKLIEVLRNKIKRGV